MKKSNRSSSLHGRPGIPRSSSLDSLGTDSKKLEEDIVMMESALQQHRTKMMQQDLAIRSQISKATGSSRWISGGKGQLKGYKSHKDLKGKDGNPGSAQTRPTKARPSSGKHAARKAKPESTKIESSNIVQGYGSHRVEQKYSNAAHGTKTSHQVETDIHADEIHPASKMRSTGSRGSQGILSGRQKKEGTVRRVSFDLSDEDDLSDGDDVQPTDAFQNESGLNPLYDLNTHHNDYGSVYPDRIAALKAKVIAKASANVEPESVQTKVKTKPGQPKKIKKPTSAKTQQHGKDSRSTSANKSARQEKTIQLEASGTEVKKVVKGKPKPKHEKQFLENEPVDTYLKWDGYDEGDRVDVDDDFDSHSSSDVFLIEPSANYSPPQAARQKQVVEHDPAVTAWLYSLNLLDPEKYSQIFHSHNMTMEAVLKLTERQLKTMGVTSFVALKKILDGVKILKREAKSQTKVPKMSAASDASQIQAIQNILDTRPITKTSIAGTHTNEWKEEAKRENSFSIFADLPLDVSGQSNLNTDLRITGSGDDKLEFPDESDDDLQVWEEKSPVTLSKDLDLTGGSNIKSGLPMDDNEEMHPKKNLEKKILKDHDNLGKDLHSGSREKTELQDDTAKGIPVQRKKGPVLTSSVVNRSLASGVHAASSKLKNKQEQQRQDQLRQDKLKRAKKAERDRMAKQHAQRLKERAERQRREEEEGMMGYEEEADMSDDGSPRATQTVDLVISSQGVLQLSHREEKTSGRSTSGKTPKRVIDHQEESFDDVALPSPEQKLQDLELQISGLQGSTTTTTTNQNSSETEAKLTRIQQQLNELQLQLRPKTAVHVPKSDDDLAETAAKAQQKRVQSAPIGKSHRRTRTKSLSKQDLLKEVKKQKEKHKKEIKLLESELNRLKYRDLVKSCELPEEDIVFDESDVLGEGTFSQVFSGNFNGSEVAIKRLKIPIQESDHNYFAEEVSLLHELRHPRVVLLLGVCTTGRLPLMVLEYMAGGSLYHYLHDSKRPSLDHVGYFQIARDICLGMNYLHRHKPVVLHLDLKSMNVLLGAYGRAKIADFGFAKIRHESNAGKVQGTPAWMAPELLENIAELTTKADVYSFAIILWEMLTRDSPYEGMSVCQVLERVRRKKRLEIPASCPEPLRRLICACWEHKPNKRPSFKDILISLEGLSFPPEWKALLSAAGIPRETMEDPTSARNIISMVNQSMHMSQMELDQMALESHTQLMKACHMEIPEEVVEEDVEEASGEPSNRENVLDSVEDVGGSPHGMEDSGYDDDPILMRGSARGATARRPGPFIPQAPPPPAIAPPSTTPTLGALMAQSKSLCNTRDPGALHSADRDGPSFQLDATTLTNQREQLRNTTRGPHPSQLADLGTAPESKLVSIADILKKAVNARRVALNEDLHSKEDLQNLWSMDSPR